MAEPPPPPTGGDSSQRRLRRGGRLGESPGESPREPASSVLVFVSTYFIFIFLDSTTLLPRKLYYHDKTTQECS